MDLDIAKDVDVSKLKSKRRRLNLPKFGRKGAPVPEALVVLPPPRVATSYCVDTDPFCTKLAKDATQRAGSFTYLMRVENRKNIKYDSQTIQYAEQEAIDWETRMEKNFPVFAVDEDIGALLTRGPSPQLYYPLVREVIRRCNPQDLENITYSSDLAKPNIELENFWSTLNTKFELDKRVRTIYPVVHSSTMGLDDKWELAECTVDRKTMLQSRSECFLVLVDHPYYKDADYCTQAKLRGLLICMWDRVYTNRMLRLTIGYAVETKPRDGNPFLDDLVMHLGYDASLQSPLGRIDLGLDYEEELGEANWETFGELKSRAIIQEDLKAMDWI